MNNKKSPSSTDKTSADELLGQLESIKDVLLDHNQNSDSDIPVLDDVVEDNHTPSVLDLARIFDDESLNAEPGLNLDHLDINIAIPTFKLSTTENPDDEGLLPEERQPDQSSPKRGDQPDLEFSDLELNNLDLLGIDPPELTQPGTSLAQTSNLNPHLLGPTIAPSDGPNTATPETETLELLGQESELLESEPLESRTLDSEPLELETPEAKNQDSEDLQSLTPEQELPHPAQQSAKPNGLTPVRSTFTDQDLKDYFDDAPPIDSTNHLPEVITKDGLAEPVATPREADSENLDFLIQEIVDECIPAIEDKLRQRLSRCSPDLLKQLADKHLKS